MSSLRMATGIMFEPEKGELVVDWEKHMPGSSEQGYVVKFIHEHEPDDEFVNVDQLRVTPDLGEAMRDFARRIVANNKAADELLKRQYPRPA